MSEPVCVADRQPLLAAQEPVATAGVVMLLVVTALFVVAQLYLAIPLLAYVGQAFSSATSEAVSFALATCFSLAYASGFLIWGPLSDQYGRRSIMLVGLVALSVFTFACAFVSSLSWLAGLRALQGLVASSFAPVALAYLAEAVPVRHRPTAIGAMSTAFLVAGIFGQVIASWIAIRWDWPQVFLITGTCLVVLIPLIAIKVKGPRSTVNGHLGHRFIALGRIATRPAVILLSCAHAMLLLSFVAMYTALGAHLNALGLDAEKVVLLRLIGLPGMFAALLVGSFAMRIGMPGVAGAGYVIAALGLTLQAVFSQTLTGIVLGSLIFVIGVALALPAMITQFGAMGAPDRAAGMALNGFVLFAGASAGPFIALKAGHFVTLLGGLIAALLAAALCIAGSALIASTGKRGVQAS